MLAATGQPRNTSFDICLLIAFHICLGDFPPTLPIPRPTCDLIERFMGKQVKSQRSPAPDLARKVLQWIRLSNSNQQASMEADVGEEQAETEGGVK